MQCKGIIVSTREYDSFETWSRLSVSYFQASSHSLGGRQLNMLGDAQVASLSLFCSLDLDMLRTCPYQSWTNVAERIMSTLNLALQNVYLARSNMSQRAEAVLKKKKLWMKLEKQ